MKKRRKFEQTNELVVDMLEVLDKHIELPPNLLRNERIKLEYKKMREVGVKSLEAREIIAEKNFIDVKSLEKIIYGKGKE